MPSTVVGAVALRNEALNWTPCVRSLIQAAARLDELAGRDHRRMAKDGDQIALAAGFDPQHAEAVLVVVERDALDQPGQDLGWGACLRCLRHCYMMEINAQKRYSVDNGQSFDQHIVPKSSWLPHPN